MKYFNCRWQHHSENHTCTHTCNCTSCVLLFFVCLGQKKNRSVKSGNSSPFPCLFLTSKFSSFPCTFDRYLEPVLMIQQSYNGRDVNSPFHMEREVWPLSRNPNFQSTIAVYIFWKVGKQFFMPRWWPDGDIS